MLKAKINNKPHKEAKIRQEQLLQYYRADEAKKQKTGAVILIL